MKMNKSRKVKDLEIIYNKEYLNNTKEEKERLITDYLKEALKKNVQLILIMGIDKSLNEFIPNKPIDSLSKKNLLDSVNKWSRQEEIINTYLLKNISINEIKLIFETIIQQQKKDTLNETEI